jgi:hypothetical protein
MKTHIAAGLVACVAGTALSMPSATAAPAPAWERLPDPEAIERYYPPEALKQRVEGKATLVCQVGAPRRGISPLINCHASDESPPNLGFGTAVLEMAPLFGMRDLKGGEGWVSIPISFKLPRKAAGRAP